MLDCTVKNDTLKITLHHIGMFYKLRYFLVQILLDCIVKNDILKMQVHHIDLFCKLRYI